MELGTMSLTKWFGILLLAVIGGKQADPDLAASHRALSQTPQALVAQTETQAQTIATAQAKPQSDQELHMVSAGNVTATYKLVPKLNKDAMGKYTPVEVVATGYYAGKESTGKGPGHPEYGVTYSGVKVKRDEFAFSTIAADPKVFPIGTVLYVPGYGYGVVADTGGAIKGKKIDLYFDTKDQVFREWGKKTIKVFVVKKGEGKMTEMMWNQLQSEILNTPAV